MTTQTKEQRAQTIFKAREALQKARALRESRQTLGVDGIKHFVADVDGNWLEDWAEKDLNELPKSDKKILCPI